MRVLDDTIVARATAAGAGAIAIIRLCGDDALTIASGLCGRKLADLASHTVHFARFKDSKGIIDEGVFILFKAPSGYTGQDTVEFNVHGSEYIVERMIRALCALGARPADPGEFTLRAFLNGKLDLAQAEGVADMIASDSEASHSAAIKQLKGGVSAEIFQLRGELVHFASLLELELDFSEEDVEFADRSQLLGLLSSTQTLLQKLINTFKYGNAIKSGVQVVLAGRPNAGKSTLFNLLLGDDRAIVSDIAGTTRDSIEDFLVVNGLKLRLTDTAGLHEATDTIEKLGIERTYKHMSVGAVTLFIFDISDAGNEAVSDDLLHIKAFADQIIVVGNKLDKSGISEEQAEEKFGYLRSSVRDLLFISSKNPEDSVKITDSIFKLVSTDEIAPDQSLITSVRHYDALMKSSEAIEKTKSAIIDGVSGELLAFEIRSALNALGEITGEVTTDDLLDNIFSKFCIGK